MAKKHIILVHGACHGAWCWYKVVAKLRAEADGKFQVTAIDLAASGIDRRRIEEVQSFAEYTKPLLDLLSSLPADERVILVGHSFGGFNIARAMDEFSEKIAVGVFVTAFLPDTENKPSEIFEKVKKIHLDSDPSFWMDTQIEQGFPNFMLFGSKFIYSKLYHLCSPEDYSLGLSLLRPVSLFLEDFPCMTPFKKSGYGATKKVYIICSKDKIIQENYQHEMISNYQVEEIKVMKDADHMPMLSCPYELVKCLSEIARKY